MKDIQKIQEFFSKPLNEESTTFKVGDKVTYLGHPAEITKVNKEITGAITYNVSYDKGNGKTKVTNIHSKDDSIKPIKEDFGQALFNRLKPKDSDLEAIVNTLKQDPKIANSPDQASFKEALERYIRFSSDKNSIGQAAVRALEYRNTGSRYGSGFDRIFDMLVDKKNLKEGNEEYYKPKIRKDKNDPKVLYVDIAYPAGSGFTTALGSKTMSGRDREEGAAKALSMGNNIAKKLEVKYNIEYIGVSDGKNGKVTVFAVSDDFIEMASPSLDEANGFKSGGEFISTKLQKYPKAVAKINQLIDMIGESNFTMEMAEWLFDFFNNSHFESPMNEAKISHFEIGDVVELKSIPENLPFEIRNGSIDNKWEITRVSKSGRSMYSDMMEDVFGYDIELLDKKLKYKMFVYPEDVKQSMNEAKEEDKVDTITMDIPLFIRMLEYSREDAAEDMDLHDVTEKANKLGKEKGILSMEDYDAIVGAAENAPKGEINEDEGIKVGDIVSKKYASTDEDYTKEFKVINITGMSATLQDTKTGKKVGIFLNDLTKSPMKEATTDYSKRRQAQDDYAINKKDKPAKSYNPTPSGKTDYMKRREKELAEIIFAKLKK
jgi:hypothetical protein